MTFSISKSAIIERIDEMDRLEAVTIFVAVAEHESFAGAARHLNRSPAAITRAVAALEEHL